MEDFAYILPYVCREVWCFTEVQDDVQDEYQPGCDGGAVEDVEKGSSYSQQIGKAVEAKIDQMSCQLHNLDVKHWSVKFMVCLKYLKSKLILLGITESPHLVNNVLEVVLHKVHGLAEPAPDRLPGVVLRLVAVVVADAQLQGNVRPQSCILHWFHFLLGIGHGNLQCIGSGPILWIFQEYLSGIKADNGLITRVGI